MQNKQENLAQATHDARKAEEERLQRRQAMLSSAAAPVQPNGIAIAVCHSLSAEPGGIGWLHHGHSVYVCAKTGQHISFSFLIQLHSDI